MKNFRFETAKIHRQDLKNLKESTQKAFLENNTKLANMFGRDYAAIGVLDYNDLVQECHLAFLVAWERVNWARIETAKNPDAALWSFLKKSIINDVRHAINGKKDGIRIPTHKLWETKGKNLDDHLSILFPNFFSQDEWFALIDESDSIWDIEQLAIGLEEAMDAVLSPQEKRLLNLVYGIDCEKLSMKKLASMYQTSENNISKRKNRALKKLQENAKTKLIIENYYDI